MNEHQSGGTVYAFSTYIGAVYLIETIFIIYYIISNLFLQPLVFSIKIYQTVIISIHVLQAFHSYLSIIYIKLLIWALEQFLHVLMLMAHLIMHKIMNEGQQQQLINNTKFLINIKSKKIRSLSLAAKHPNLSISLHVFDIHEVS